MEKSTLFIFLLMMLAKGFANVKPNSLFSNNMVLQRGVEVPVWGTADDAEKVTVEFNGQKVSTVAKNGKWIVKLKELKASNKPSMMIIYGNNTIKIENILVGEVWVCSGQSNMDMTMSSAWPKHIINWEEEIAAANYPLIRQFHVAHKASDTLVTDAKTSWIICDTVSVKDYSAVGYFFAKNLFKSMKVPIGLLFSAYAGTPAEKWTSRGCLESNDLLKPCIAEQNNAQKKYLEELKIFNSSKDSLIAKWKDDSLAASINNKAIPNKPKAPWASEGVASSLYNGMINPLIPFAIKGVIWYQGEGNSRNAKRYQTLFPAMINDWRANWHQDQFPFLFVQIAPYYNIMPDIREAQLLTLNKVSNTAMAVITDCGDSLAIHPAQKQQVGYRLSLSARAIAYKENIEYSGPLYKGFEVKGNTIEISFTHIGKGLLAKDGELIGFTIASSDKKFIPAKAVISGDKIIVSSSSISNPVAVRYGWSNYPVVNLFNAEGLPASPFRTDLE